ncbi:MAG TPA: hypothetical protein VF815_41340 [Myxococcaceae bacterium]|jgi:hypothetical protein
MQAFSRWIALATLVSGVAYADKNDIQISRLGNPDANELGFSERANSDFQAFARTFGAAITSANLMPPETLGHSGFNVNVELSVVSLPSDTVIPTEGGEQPGSVLMPSVHVRKGLPFSIEMGGRVGWVERSRMLAATAELKWAVNEGFTYLPDIGVRGHVTRLVGVRDFSLTAAGVDAGVGKQFPLGGMVTLTPYGGVDFTFIRAESSVIDFNPNRSYEDTVGSPLAGFENTAAYERLGFTDNMNQRIYGGVRFIGGVLQLGAEISVTRLGSVKEVDAGTQTRSLTSVLAFNTSLGLDF